jgi:endonuclease/exonuclease/phosphatase family metal-dependent hydrolase
MTKHRIQTAFVVCALLMWGAGLGAKETVSVMTFNVENLFDTKDDPAKNDETFLPLAQKQSKAHKKKCAKIDRAKWRRECLEFDWSEAVLAEKMKRLAQVIRAGAREDRGADLVLLQEVENIDVLRRLLAETSLKELGYQPVLVEGRDVRGIDVALLTKLPVLGKPRLHTIPFRSASRKQKRDARGILETVVRLPGGQELTVFVVHFPAPFHPARLREQAFGFLNDLAMKKQKEKPGTLMIAGGDFNLTSKEAKASGVLERLVAPRWVISERFGCEGCKGTSYFPPDKSWSFLDKILLSQSFVNGPKWRAQKESVRIVLRAHPQQLNAQGEPVPFDPRGPVGVSDHLPVVLELRAKSDLQ